MADWTQLNLHRGVNLAVEHRVQQQDAARQQRTAAEILRRFATQPGVILADEVGMGKTFVALAVAVSVILGQRRQRQPVVVMTPTGLQKKWQDDFRTFCECCLPTLPDEAEALKRRAIALKDGEDLFHQLDLPPAGRPWLIFITHGALNRRLKDEWIKLALMRRALLHQRDASLRRKVIKCASRLLRMQGETRRAESGEALWSRLLDTPPAGWKKLLVDEGLRQEADGEPVPETLLDALCADDFAALRTCIQKLPERNNDSVKDRLDQSKNGLNKELQELWKLVLTRQRHRLPLLILDEAHHAKNPHTGLASLFGREESKKDTAEIKPEAFVGKFERMLFLTATPFQLGHAELCQVLKRFQGVFLPRENRERTAYGDEIDRLRATLDDSQHQAQHFEHIWATHCPATMATESWREFPEVQQVLRTTQERFEAAQALLRKWVIRHTRPRELSREFPGLERRVRRTGDAIMGGPGHAGITVSGAAVLPFLLAARAALMQPETRPVFAEGLASSYEAFRQTRDRKEEPQISEEQVDTPAGVSADRATAWYLARLEAALPLHDPSASAAHPKIAATVRRVLELWERGEKVVVFFHYRRTGRKLRQLISQELRLRIRSRFNAKQLQLFSSRFDDPRSPARTACDQELERLLRQFTNLAVHADDLKLVARRFLSTPSYLSRCLPAGVRQSDADTLRLAFAHCDGSNLSFREVLEQFCNFLSKQCSDDEERQKILNSLKSVQVGQGSVDDLDENELQGDERNIVEPNVRLVNGTTSQDTREKLKQTFNSPFFPEILITSNVMAEGVDLHRFCRHVIHHDLAWNPSTIEQRTGRIDRIGCKAEQPGCGQPIQVDLPYLAATQDEKQYQVVTYRERWFGILMGEDYRADSLTTERLSSRLPLPVEIVNMLTLNLSV